MKRLLCFCCLALLSFHVRGQDYTQAPDHAGGFESNERFAVADDFVFQSTTEINYVTWWGNNEPDRASGNFKIRLFANGETIALQSVDNYPAVLLMETSGRGIMKRATGRLLFTGSKAAEEEYQYTVALPRPFIAQAGVRYWLSVVSESDTDWIWEASASQENSGIVHNLIAGEIQGDIAWLGENGNTAFELRRY